MSNSNPKSQSPATSSAQLALVPAAAPHKITFSVAESALAQNKCFKRDAQGRVIQSSVALTSLRNFDFTRIDLKADLSITELGRVVERLTQSPRQSLNMCVPKGGATKLKNARRLIYDDPKTGDQATLEVIDRTLIVFDVDGADTREIPNFDWDQPEKWIYGDLPEEFRGCGVVVVYSSSCRVPVEGKVTGTRTLDDGTEEEVIKYKTPNPHILKAHYILIPDRPFAAASMKAFLQEKYPGSETGIRTYDMALFTENQIHFTADPTFLGVEDPFAGSSRIHVLEGPRAVLPPEIVDLDTYRAQFEAEEAEEDRKTGLTRLQREHQDRVMGFKPLTEDTSWIAAALNTVDPSRCEYNTRLAVCRALCSLFGGSAEGNRLWHEWISQASGSKWSDHAYAEAKWDDSLSRQGDLEAETRTLLGIAKRLGGFSVREWREAQLVKPLTALEVANIKAKGEEPHWRWDNALLKLVRAGTRPTSDPLRRPAAIDSSEVFSVAAAYVTSATSTDAEGRPVPPVWTESALWTCDPATYVWRPRRIESKRDAIMSDLQLWGALGKTQCGTEKVRVSSEDGTDVLEDKPRFFRFDPKQRYTQAVLSLLDRPELTGQHADVNPFDQAPYGLALRDKFLKVDLREKKVIVEDLSPRHYVRDLFEFTHSEIMAAVDTPLFDAFTAHLFQGDESASKIQYALTFGGLALLGATTRLHIPALILKGERGSGKSTWVQILEACFPEGSTSTVTVQQWADPTALVTLAGKRLNIDYDVDHTEPIRHYATIRKAIFGEDRISARQVYKELCEFVPRAAHIWCCNELFTIPGADPATLDRLFVLDLDAPTVRGTAQADPDLKRKILEREKAGIVRKMILAAESFFANGAKMPLIKSSAEAKKEWELTDGAARYADEWLEVGDTFCVTNDRLWKHYEAYALAHGEKPLSIESLSRRLKKFAPSMISKKNEEGVRCKYGIRIRPYTDPFDPSPNANAAEGVFSTPTPTPPSSPSQGEIEALREKLARMEQELERKETEAKILREAVKAQASQGTPSLPTQEEDVKVQAQPAQPAPVEAINLDTLPTSLVPRSAIPRVWGIEIPEGDVILDLGSGEDSKVIKEADRFWVIVPDRLGTILLTPDLLRSSSVVRT